MKKKILSVMIVSAMLLSSTAAFAETAAVDTTADTVVTEQVQAEVQPAFARMELTVVSNEDGVIETTDENGGTVFLFTP